MKQLFFTFSLLFVYSLHVSAQDVYTHYFAVYGIENKIIEVMVCKTEPYEYVSDKITGMNGINLVPEAKFRSWLKNTYGDKITQSAFYPAKSSEQAINYYKSHIATYQQSQSKYQNSSYCNSIFSIPYVENIKKPMINTSSSSTPERAMSPKSTTTNSPSTATSNKPKRSSTSDNKTVNTQPPKLSKDEEVKKAIATANEQINNNNLANEAQQQRTQEQVNSVVGGVAQLATGIMANVAADRERKEENLRRTNEKIKEKNAKANILLNNFLTLAKEGNEYAITQCIEAYNLLDVQNSALNTIRDGYSVPKSNYITFLTDSYQKFQSPSAKKALTEYYTKVESTYKSVAAMHRRKAIGQPILAGVFAAGCIIGGNELSKTENSDEAFTPSAIIQTVGVLGGGALFVSGLIHLVRVGQTNNDEGYKDAKSKLQRMKFGQNLTVLPTFKHSNGSLGLALNFKF